MPSMRPSFFHPTSILPSTRRTSTTPLSSPSCTALPSLGTRHFASSRFRTPGGAPLVRVRIPGYHKEGGYEYFQSRNPPFYTTRKFWIYTGVGTGLAAVYYV
ncbi:hypothetical protein HDU76_004357, partial [Blyttiomyces sp. JEL0837]